MNRQSVAQARQRARYRAAGKCTYCPALAVPGRRLCSQHATYYRLRRAAWRKAQKEARR